MRTIQSNGISLHYAESGPPNAPALVLINSLGTDLRLWDGVVAVLSARFRVVTYDKRGHGLSQVVPAPYRMQDHTDDLAGLLDALNIQRAIVCGLSVGGVIAMQFAVQHPERVVALVLADTAPKIGTVEGWNERIATVSTSGVAGIAAGVAQRWFSADFCRRESAALAAWTALLSACPTEGYAGTCAALRDTDLTEAAAHIRVPTLCLCGTEDVATTPAQMQALANSIAGARLNLIAGCGHLPPAERPVEFAQLIHVFIDAAQDDYSIGMNTRRQVLGAAHVDRATRDATAFDQDFQRYITEVAWGKIWSRDVLTRRERSLVTIALLTALNHHEELAMHLRASRNTGATMADIREVLLHTAVYAGVPCVNHAFKIARDIFADGAGASA